MLRSLRKLSSRGDDTVAEWDPQTLTPEDLARIDAEFRRLQAEGYFAFDITDGRNVRADRFNPQADLLMIPRVVGG